MIRRPPRSTHCISSAASDVYKRQVCTKCSSSYLLYSEDCQDCYSPCSTGYFGDTSVTPNSCVGINLLNWILCRYCQHPEFLCWQSQNQFIFIYNFFFFFELNTLKFQINKTACESHCDTCTSSTVCTKCSSSYFLYSQDCYSPCSTGYFGDTSVTPNSCAGNHQKLLKV
eukprot:TRINITY_DN5432_c0_g1_i13.p2 TRINITY_DN5432_c0_g1~~TRINITY_DN5432_c0_g1_i13.p2  ORF type:complete len:170 (+),score=25.00 TRINITY_DN5432_c0_g1_i13:122-631(+)